MITILVLFWNINYYNVYYCKLKFKIQKETHFHIELVRLNHMLMFLILSNFTSHKTNSHTVQLTILYESTQTLNYLGFSNKGEIVLELYRIYISTSMVTIIFILYSEKLFAVSTSQETHTS